MTDSYQAKLAEQIANCDAEIDQMTAEINAVQVRRRALADALEMYNETKPTRRATSVRRTRKSHSKSRFDFIMDEIKKSGVHGLTPAEMFEKAQLAGIDIKRTTMRSQLWQRKQDGRLETTDTGRYRVSLNENNEDTNNETPDEYESSGVSEGNGSLPLH